MNILPKKRWHVRTKDNIARVRKDEAEAREDERKRQEKLELAESEARVNFLRKRTGLTEKHSTCKEPEQQNEVVEDEGEKSQHINLFADYKIHVKTTNTELEKEKKAEQEKYEKQIGYLTYLGQDTNESLRLKSWYEVAPKRIGVGAERGEINEKDLKIKYNHDPMTLINALLPPDPKYLTKTIIKPKRTPSPLAAHKKVEEVSKDLKKSKKNEKEHKKHKKYKHKKHSKEKHGKHKKDKSKEKDIIEEQLRKRLKLEQLRKERLRRENAERARQEDLLAPKESSKIPKAAPCTTPRVVQKYNSQFNPELAKQNMN